MKTGYTLIGTVACMIVAATGAGAITAAPHETIVKVVLVDPVAEIAPKINAIEQQREKAFRRYFTDRRDRRLSDPLPAARRSRANWAGAELIPRLADYTIGKLTSAIARHDLKIAGIDSPGEVLRITISRIGVATYPLSAVDREKAFVEGRLQRLDADSGKVIAETRLIANLVPFTTFDNAYSGPDYAFPTEDARRRIGPALAYFVKVGLERLYPGHAFPRPVIVTRR